MRDELQTNKQTNKQTLKIELLSQWKLEAEFRNCGFHVNAGTEQITKSMVRQLHHVSPSTSASG